MERKRLESLKGTRNLLVVDDDLPFVVNLHPPGNIPQDMKTWWVCRHPGSSSREIKTYLRRTGCLMSRTINWKMPVWTAASKPPGESAWLAPDTMLISDHDVQTGASRRGGPRGRNRLLIAKPLLFPFGHFTIPFRNWTKRLAEPYAASGLRNRSEGHTILLVGGHEIIRRSQKHS